MAGSDYARGGDQDGLHLRGEEATGMKSLRRQLYPAHWVVRWLAPDSRAWWWIWWTPRWHDGRGPYISVGLYYLAVYRGY